MAKPISLPESFTRAYRVVAELGTGAFSAVYRMKQVSLGREVVAKLFWSKAFGDDEEIIARVLQEARLLAGLRHPNVIELLDHGVAGDLVYLVYPFERAKALDEHPHLHELRREPGLTDLLAQCLEGLAAIHEAGVIHRDLKPGNILVTLEDEVKLIDFGLARDLQASAELTTTGVFLGTPAYASPAQILGETPDPRDDLYSLGAVAYQLVTGENPFVAPGLEAVFQRHLDLVPPPPAEVEGAVVSPELSAWILRLLEKDRGDRPASAKAALQLLRSPPAPAGVPWDSGEVTEARPPLEDGPALAPSPLSTVAAPAPAELRESSRGAVLLRGFALALLAAVAAVALLRSPAPPPAAHPPSAPAGPLPFLPALLDDLRARAPWDPDPMRVEEFRRRLRGADALRAWQVAGLPALRDLDRTGLQEADVILARRGLGRPFYPAAYLTPMGSPVTVELPGHEDADPSMAWPARLGGWSGTAAFQLARFRRHLEDLRARVRDVLAMRTPVEELIEIPPDARAYLDLTFLVRSEDDAEVHRWLEACAFFARQQAAVEDLLRDVARAGHATLWATARALEEDRAAGRWVAVAAWHRLRDARELWIGGLAFLDAASVFGRLPDVPEAALLEARHLRSTRDVHAKVLRYGKLVVPASLQVESAALRRRLRDAATGDLPDPVDRHRAGQALEKWMDEIRRQEDLPLLLEEAPWMIATHGDQPPEVRSRVVKVTLYALEDHLEEAPLPGPEELRAMRALADALPLAGLEPKVTRRRLALTRAIDAALATRANEN